MKVVLDASAGIEIALSRAKAGTWSAVLLAAEQVISSDLYKAEVANVIWKYVRAGLLDKSKASNTLQLAQGLVDEYVDMAENNEEAMHESFRLGHSTYDLLYLTLARRLGAKLMTSDMRLRDLAEASGIEVVI